MKVGLLVASENVNTQTNRHTDGQTRFMFQKYRCNLLEKSLRLCHIYVTSGFHLIHKNIWSGTNTTWSIHFCIDCLKKGMKRQLIAFCTICSYYIIILCLFVIDSPLRKKQFESIWQMTNAEIHACSFSVQLPFRSMTEVGQLLYLHFEVIPQRIDKIDLGSFYALAHDLSTKKKTGFRKSLWVPFLVTYQCLLC